MPWAWRPPCDSTTPERPTTVGRDSAASVTGCGAALATDPGVEFTGHPTDRLPGHLSLLVRGVEGAAIVVALDLEGIAASAGPACTTGSPEVSHVLAAMGYPDEEARGALRLSLGRTTTEADVERAAEVVPAIVARLRSGSSAMAADPLGQEIGV